MFKQLMTPTRHGRKSKKKRREHGIRRRPTLQTLEGRELMAGNVTVGLTGGDLVIYGDNASNGVKVSRINDTTVEVQGTRHAGADTRINGATKPVRVRVTDDVRVDLRGGNDEINFHGDGERYPLRVADDLFVYTGDGNDEIGMFDVKTGSDIVVNTGSGRDSLTAVTVTTGEHMFVGDWGSRYNAGDTNQVIIYDGSHIGGQLYVSLNQGNDALKATEVTAGSIYVQAHAGNDGITLNHVQTTQWVYADPGTGSDRTTVENSKVGTHLYVVANSSYRSDYDRIDVTKSSIGSYLYIKGNQGRERVNIDRTSHAPEETKSCSSS